MGSTAGFRINGETRTYNEQKQLTGINVPGLGSITYSFSSANNNGRITGMTNTITGESVTYAYDSLNRLISASAGGQWGLSFSYDGFGNRLSQNVTAGSAPTIQQSYDMTTNRLQGQYYDANGNMGGISWVVENRLLQIQGQTAPYSTDTYDYGIDNKRIYKQTYLQSGNPEEVYFYVAGRKIATYTLAYLDITGDGYQTILFTQPKYNVYFGSRLMIANGQNVVLDRLGSVVWDGAPHSYFSYGEERTPTANNKDKFATYFRDASTGLDYADQRFYSNLSGRFSSADPYKSSAGPRNPGSWNRYQYVEGDPINLTDPHGLYSCVVVDRIFEPDDTGAVSTKARIECSSTKGTVSGSDWVEFTGEVSRDAILNATKDVQQTLGSGVDQQERWNFLYDAYVQAQNDLKDNPECQQVFGTVDSRQNGWDPGTVLGNLFWHQGGLGSVGYGPTLGATALTVPTLAGFAIGAVININDSQWFDISASDRGILLLHELGHAYNLLSARGSGGSAISQFDIIPTIQDKNNSLIWATCGVVPPVKRK